MYINSYKYIPSESKLLTGIKDNKTPKGAIYGGNGTWRIAVPPQIIVFINNNTCFDAYSIFKENTERKVTEKFVSMVLIPLIHKEAENEQAIRNMIAEEVRI